MKKRYVRAAMIAGLVLAIGLGSVATVAAQGPGRPGIWGGAGIAERWPIKGTVLETIADLLGLSVDELSLQFWGGRTLADLAEKAGVDLADLRSAVTTSQKEARRAAIEEAVAEGTITQEHADWLLEGLDNGYSTEIGALRRGLMGAALTGRGDEQPQLEAMAELLGLTPEELSDQLWGGKTLADLADEAGVSLQELKDAADAARENSVRDAIAEAVENGDISQEQADWLLRGLDEGYWDCGPGSAMMARGLRGMARPGLRGRGC